MSFKAITFICNTDVRTRQAYVEVYAKGASIKYVRKFFQEFGLPPPLYANSLNPASAHEPAE